jgi:hypothetical protein
MRDFSASAATHAATATRSRRSGFPARAVRGIKVCDAPAHRPPTAKDRTVMPTPALLTPIATGPRLAIRPGRPVAFGTVAGKAFVGLPGNPVAMAVTFLRFARPMLLRLAGALEAPPLSFRVRAGFAVRKKEGRREWLRARLVRGDDGMPTARRFPRDGAGILTSLVESDGLVELAEEVTDLPEGASVDFLPWSELAS